MSSVLFIENSQPFPRVLLSALVREGGFRVDRAFSPVHAVNKMKERTYNLVVMCGTDSGKPDVQNAARAAGASFLFVSISPDRPPKTRQGILQDASLVLEDLHNATEFSLSGWVTVRLSPAHRTP